MRDLSSCAEECFKCIRNYKKKHSLIQGQSFDIKCGGIPSEYVPFDILKDLPEEALAVSRGKFPKVKLNLSGLCGQHKRVIGDSQCIGARGRNN